MKKLREQAEIEALTLNDLIDIHEGVLEKPKALLKTTAKELLIEKFYEQYTKKYDTWEQVTGWAEMKAHPVVAKKLVEQVQFFASDILFPAFARYLIDLKGQPLAYVVAPGILVYNLPEVYYVPDLHSKAKIAPVGEVDSVIYKLMGAIAGKNIGDLFETYHEAMLYGKLTVDDNHFSAYTEHHWMGLNKLFEGTPKVRQVLDQKLALIRKDGFTIEAIGKHLTPFIEKNLRVVLNQGL